MPGTIITWTPEPLRPSDSIEEALGRILDEACGVLPAVDAAGALVGVVTESNLLEADSPDAEVASVLKGFPVSIAPDAHVFEATKLMVQHDMAALPVVDEGGHYLGFARRHDIFERFANMLATQESGAVVSVEVEPRDYSLAKLVHTIEQNDVQIRSIVSEAPTEDSGSVRLTLKLNVVDAARVRHMLEHYGYRVAASYGEIGDEEDLRERIEAFVRYLEV